MFEPLQNQQAFLKCAIFGDTGSGKTTLAVNIAFNLCKYLKENNVCDKPVFFIDTENGSDFFAEYMQNLGIQVFVKKTRTFSELLTLMDYAEKNGSVLIIDSVTHFWEEIQDSYRQKKKKEGKESLILTMTDWGPIKAVWKNFTKKLVTSKINIIVCARMSKGDAETDSNGKLYYDKNKFKINCEKDFHYDPSLILMTEVKNFDVNEKMDKTFNAYVLKDRIKEPNFTLNGKVFNNPEFSNILPHLQYLKIGGEQAQFSDATSESLFNDIKKPDYNKIEEDKKKEVYLDEIKNLLLKFYPSRSVEDTNRKNKMLEKHAKVNSWKVFVAQFSSSQIRDVRDAMWKELEGKDYYESREPETTDEINM